MSCKFIKSKLLVAVPILLGFVIVGCNNNSMEKQSTEPKGKEFKTTGKTNRIRLEHVAINVEDPEGMVKWYCENIGMKLLRKGSPPVNMHFISDSGGNMMLEVYHNPPDAVPDYPSMNPLSLHISFMVYDVKGICRKLVAAGATMVDDVSTTESGDEIAMLRDPWGVPIQFVKRAKPMLQYK